MSSLQFSRAVLLGFAVSLASLGSMVPVAMAQHGLKAEAEVLGPVTVGPVTVTFSAKVEEKFEEDYGVRERSRAADVVAGRLAKALQASGSGYTARVTVNAIQPNRPTMKQLSDTPGLSYSSFGIGGADLTADIYGPEGTLVGTVAHKWFESDIEFAQFESDWGDARTAAGRLASKARALIAG
jgi:hypothetical protein